MLKKIILTLVLAIAAYSIGAAQTLKVTAVNATEDRLYNFAAEHFLGKSMTLTIYDNSVSVKLPGRDAIILRETSDGTYRYLYKDMDTEAQTFVLTVNKTVGVVTSAELELNVDEKGGQHRHAGWSLMAKRF